MRGTLTTPFSTLFADTVNMHGLKWSYTYYLKNGMNVKEFTFWAIAGGFVK